jgi:hypothetical protein
MLKGTKYYQCMKKTPGLLAVKRQTAEEFALAIVTSRRMGMMDTACVPSHMGVLVAPRYTTWNGSRACAMGDCRYRNY